jgi:purine catabolism regulator
MFMNTTTIRDLLRLVLPSGSTLATAAHGLQQHVGPAASLRATLPAFPQLRGGELALISVAQARMLDERLTLPTIVERLAQVPVAAIAVLGPIDDEALAVADATDLPLLHLPDGTDLRHVERDLQRLLADPDLQYERRAAQLYTDLTQHVAAGDGVEAILRVLGERTGRAVALLGVDGVVRLQRGPHHLAAAFGALRTPISATQTVLGYEVQTCLIGQAAARLGYVALAGDTLDRWDALALAQAAAACALELSKQQAVQAAEARVRGDVLRTILSGTITDPQLLQQQAAEFGYDLLRPHSAVVIASVEGRIGVAQLHDHLRRILQRQHIAAPSIVRDEHVICFCPSDDDYTQPYALLHALADTHAITAGISRPVASAASWPRAYDEAEQALGLSLQLFGPRSITAYSDLGVFRLLLELRGSAELRSFYHQTLGTLVGHDRANGGELVRTLEGYFAALGNVHQAAELLHVHRNTLIYRLRRISEISGLNLKRAEDVLALQLALRAHRIFKVMGEGGKQT